jgi:hypothetical protein
MRVAEVAPKLKMQTKLNKGGTFLNSPKGIDNTVAPEAFFVKCNQY